jgi:beta-lactam-binding protein with PASTA domain
VLAVLMFTACTGGHVQPSPTETPGRSGPAVPNVVGVTTGVADVRLRAVGLLLEVNTTEGMPEATMPDGLVQRQSPAAGTVVSAGSVVTVDAVCTPKPCPSPIGAAHVYDPCTCATR